MTRILLTVLLTLFTGLAAAQTVTATKDTGETETLQAAQADGAKPEPARNCLRSTGSRITEAQNLRAAKEGKPQRCANGSGKVYTSEDLERTGHIDLSSALRSLDTSMR